MVFSSLLSSSLSLQYSLLYGLLMKQCFGPLMHSLEFKYYLYADSKFLSSPQTNSYTSNCLFNISIQKFHRFLKYNKCQTEMLILTPKSYLCLAFSIAVDGNSSFSLFRWTFILFYLYIPHLIHNEIHSKNISRIYSPLQ